MFKYGDERKPVGDYVRQLETEPLEVDGYQWSSRLWRDSITFETPLREGGEAGTPWAEGRPVRAVKLDKSTAPLVTGSTYVSINPGLNGLVR
jgi:hypothetical protein